MTVSTILRRSIAAASVLVTGVFLIAVPAQAAPTTPVFDASIDPYAVEDLEKTCDPDAKPGVLSFRELALRSYPTTRDLGIVRACDPNSVSEHEEGRAFDWGVNANNAADKARAEEMLAWLLATDQYGNKHANARRLGIMYLIWNRKIWGAYLPDQGWRTYSGTNPHTDHVHVSFSWAGARKQTTWWTKADQPASWPTVRRGATGVDVQTAQYLLNATGQSLVADGQFGPATETAVKQFQAANGNTADGIVGMLTWSKLIRQVQRGSSGDAVKAAQVQLNALGYNLTVDGAFGTGTENAVKDFEQRHQLTPDGVVSPTAWQLLIAGIEA
jgi:murein L,D-transpeptidase YcbB/YkuD